MCDLNLSSFTEVMRPVCSEVRDRRQRAPIWMFISNSGLHADGEESDGAEEVGGAGAQPLPSFCNQMGGARAPGVLTELGEALRAP